MRNNIKFLMIFMLFFMANAYSAPPTLSTNSNIQNQSSSATGFTLPAAVPSSFTPFITQSNDVSTIEFGSAACSNDEGTTDNSYFRRFDLNGDHFLNSLNIESIDFGVESVSTAVTLTVNLYSIPNTASFELANLTLISTATKNVSLADTGTVVNALIKGSVNGASHDLVVEIFSPNQQATSDSFWIGSNANGETAPGYLLAADCGFNEPTTFTDLGFPNAHILMVVNGGCNDLSSLTCLNRTVNPQPFCDSITKNETTEGYSIHTLFGLPYEISLDNDLIPLIERKCLMTHSGNL